FQSAKRVIVLPGGIRLSQDVPLNLSARRTREGRQKMHGTGIRMCSVAVFDPLLKFRRELCGAVNARTQYHGGGHGLASDLVGDSEHRAFRYGAVLEYHRFNLDGPDTAAGHENGVIVTGKEKNVCIAVHVRHVASQIPPTVDGKS